MMNFEFRDYIKKDRLKYKLYLCGDILGRTKDYNPLNICDILEYRYNDLLLQMGDDYE